MPTFIKGGIWSKRKSVPKISNGELNLDLLIEKISAQNAPGSPEELTSDAIIYNAKAPFNIKEGFEISTGSTLRHLIPLPSGQFLIMGGFIEYHKQRVNGFARLNADFTLDTTFTGGGTRFLYGNGSGISYSSNTIIPVLDSAQNLYMIFEGNNIYNGVSRSNKIFKVDPIGNFDNVYSTAIGTGPNTSVNSILVLPDDGIIIAGTFTSFNGTTYNRIMRINSNGTLNSSFITNLGTGFNNVVDQAILTPTGKILCIGQFTSYNGTARNRIAQLNIDGTLDSSFNYSSGITSGLGYPRVTIDSNTGDIYLCDQVPFVYSGITTSRKIIRINSVGNYDASFAIPEECQANNLLKCPDYLHAKYFH